MTSISSIPQHPDPRSQMDARFAAEADGRIGGEDREAPRRIPDRIDAAPAVDVPEDVHGKIDGLIDSQVESGALSDGQADELRSFFAQGPATAAQDATGPMPARTDASPDAGATKPISEAATRQLDAITAFLQKLRDAAASGAITYGSNSGTSSNGSSATGWVIDRQA